MFSGNRGLPVTGVKHAFFRGVRRLGGTRTIAGSEWRRSRLLVLCYHSLSLTDEHEWNPALYMTRDLLRSRLRTLRDLGFTILPLTSALTRLREGALPPRSVALTFDDGTTDFSRLVVPLLEEFDAPATLYLTTYYCDRRLPVFDTALSYILWRGRDGGADVAAAIGVERGLPIATAEDRRRATAAIAEHARSCRLDGPAKHELLTAVAAHAGVSLAQVMEVGMFHIMPPDEVSGLPAGLVDVQLHTHRHRTPLDPSRFGREVLENRDRVRALRGSDSSLDQLCYPSGEYYREFLDWLPELGVRYATTCVPGLASQRSHPLLLPRLVDTSLQSPESFEAWLSGVAALLPKRARHRIDPERLRPAKHSRG